MTSKGRGGREGRKGGRARTYLCGGRPGPIHAADDENDDEVEVGVVSVCVGCGCRVG